MVLGDWPLGGDLGHEDGTLINEISVFIKGTPKSSMPLIPCEDTEKTIMYELGSGLH